MPPTATADALDDAPRPTRARSREVITFLAVGGAGYLTDVLAFNWLRDRPPLDAHDPVLAKVAAVAVAMVVTYLGNRLLTWRGVPSDDRRREIGLFVVFNLIGLMISVVLLALSHDVLGLTSRLADNLVGNVLGVGLGTAFRYWAYRRFVFVVDAPLTSAARAPAATGAHERPARP